MNSSETFMHVGMGLCSHSDVRFLGKALISINQRWVRVSAAPDVY